MIAQYQVDKLRSRLSERISGYGSASNKKTSVHVFKHNDKWYKVTTMKEDEIYSKTTE
jgi:predicted DNA-binding protein (MmcQ/YjbR family)